MSDAATKDGQAPLVIRSYTTVFRLERRLHKIQHWRLPLPHGLPLRGAGYAVAALVLIVLAGRLPVVGGLIGQIPAPFHYVIGPAAIGMGLARVRIDGRPAHGFLRAWARHRFSARYVSAFRPVDPPGRAQRFTESITFVPDHSGSAYRPGRIAGPCKLRLAYPVEGDERGRTLVIRQRSERPLRRAKLVTVPAGAGMVFE